MFGFVAFRSTYAKVFVLGNVGTAELMDIEILDVNEIVAKKMDEDILSDF